LSRLAPNIKLTYLEFHHTSFPNNVWALLYSRFPNISPNISATGSRNKSPTNSSKSIESTHPDQSRASILTMVLMPKNQNHDRNRSTNNHCHDRNQKYAQAGNRFHLSPGFFGGADRDRTGGLLVANQALSQLSYSPSTVWWAWIDLNYRPHPYQGCALAT
jgi:hypothetical protein